MHKHFMKVMEFWWVFWGQVLAYLPFDRIYTIYGGKIITDLYEKEN